MTTPSSAKRADLIVEARSARTQVLALWPEGVDPETLPAEKKQRLYAAIDAVAAADRRLIDAGFLRHE